MQGSGFRVQGLEVQGSGSMVQGKQLPGDGIGSTVMFQTLEIQGLRLTLYGEGYMAKSWGQSFKI